MNRTEIIPDYSHCRAAADYILGRIKNVPDFGLTLGSGLGPLASNIEVETVIPYEEIPGFPRTTVSDHLGRLIFGTVSGVHLVCMQGRFHYYEGYSFEELAMSIRVLKMLGIRCLVLTNAAGGVNLAYRPGDIMIISDHINLTGVNPTRGQYYREFGDRFYDISDLYSSSLREIAKKAAKRSSLNIHEGIYMFMPGPNFESPAEVRAIRLLGGDAVGMSTVPEALVAGHMGLPVMGFSVISNMAAGILSQPLSGEDVNETAGRTGEAFSAYLQDLFGCLHQEISGSN